MALSRLPDWEARFAQWQAGWRFARLDWRRADCLRLAAAAAVALTGADPLRQVRGRWSTPAGARRVLARTHGGDFAAAIGEFLPRFDVPGSARRGDWLLFPSGDAAFPALGVKLGAEALGFPDHDAGACAGLIPSSAAIAAFAIG